MMRSRLSRFMNDRGKRVVEKMKTLYNITDFNDDNDQSQRLVKCTPQDLKALRRIQKNRLRNLKENQAFCRLQNDLRLLHGHPRRIPSPDNKTKRQRLWNAAYQAVLQGCGVPDSVDELLQHPTCKGIEEGQCCAGDCYCLKMKEFRQKRRCCGCYQFPTCGSDCPAADHTFCGKGKMNKFVKKCGKKNCSTCRKRNNIIRRLLSEKDYQKDHDCKRYRNGCGQCSVIRRIQNNSLKYKDEVEPLSCCKAKGVCPFTSCAAATSKDLTRRKYSSCSNRNCIQSRSNEPQCYKCCSCSTHNKKHSHLSKKQNKTKRKQKTRQTKPGMNQRCKKGI